MGAVVFHIFFVLFIHDVGDVGVHEERIALKLALKEECLFFLEIEWLQFFEACGKIGGFFLALHIFFILLDLRLLLDFHFLLPFLFFLQSPFHFFLDDSQLFGLLEDALACDDGRGRVDAGFGETFGGVVFYSDLVGGIGGAWEGGVSLHGSSYELK